MQGDKTHKCTNLSNKKMNKSQPVTLVLVFFLTEKPVTGKEVCALLKVDVLITSGGIQAYVPAADI